MAQISAAAASLQPPVGALNSLHSSNPQPFSWDELSDLIGHDVIATVHHASLAYASTQGSLKLREIISEQYHSSLINAENQVLISGAQEGIFLVMNALLDVGDEVLCFSPCFEPLAQVATQVGAQVTLLPLETDKQWRINWQQLEDNISNHTKLLVINFPHNPTGAHITAAEQKQLIALCEKHHCWLLSDEVFRGLEHQADRQLPAAADLYHKAISMGVVSKSLALPGIRIGWLAMQDTTMMQSIMTIKSHLSICQSSVDTQLCETIIPHSQLIWQRNRNIIKHNKQWLAKHLIAHPELYWQAPQAAATGFVQLKTRRASDLSKIWAEKFGIMVMPNEAFMTELSGFRLTLGLPGADRYYQDIMQFDFAHPVA